MLYSNNNDKRNKSIFCINRNDCVHLKSNAGIASFKKNFNLLACKIKKKINIKTIYLKNLINI